MFLVMNKKEDMIHTLDESCDPAENDPKDRAGYDACEIRSLVHAIGIGGLVQQNTCYNLCVLERSVM